MAIQHGALPLTMISPDTNETLIRSVRPFNVSYKGETITVDLPGYYPAGDGDGVHLGDDMEPVDVALRLLKSRIDGLPTPESIRSIRQKLKHLSPRSRMNAGSRAAAPARFETNCATDSRPSAESSAAA